MYKENSTMKLLFLFSLVTIQLVSYSQSHETNELVKIASSGLKEKQEVSYNAETSSLLVDNWVIPVTRNTFVRILENNQVEFLLQRGTAVTSLQDTTLRRAWLTLPFISRKAANEFIHAFQNSISLPK